MIDNYTTIKIDIAYPDYQSERLVDFLNEGWIIMDKTVHKDRYIFYVLGKSQKAEQPSGPPSKVKEV